MKVKILSLPKHSFADGGDTGNGVTTFSGLKHGQFGLEGIPQGIASDGMPNYVQGGGFDKNGNPLKGEIKYKDYIYGGLKITKKLANKYNLPEKWVGLKYQEAADDAQQESKDRPNDPISLKSLDEWMIRLQGAQEEQKLAKATKEAAKAINNLSNEKKAILASSMMQQLAQPQYGMAQLGQMPQQPMQEVPQEALGIQEPSMDLSQPMYAEGGKIHIAKNKRGTFTAAATKHGMGVQEFASKVLAHPENYTEAMRKKAQFAKNASKWHSEGGHLYQLGGNQAYPWYSGMTFDLNTGANPTLNHAYTLGYAPTSPLVNSADNFIIDTGQAGNWVTNSGKGWSGSSDAAFVQATQGMTDAQIKALTRQQLAALMRETPAYKSTTQWLKDNSDNGLAYFTSILSDPNQPTQAKNWAKRWVQQNTDGSYTWKPNISYNYDTMIKPKREDLFPGSYWYSHPDAIKDNVRNYLQTPEGTFQLITDNNLLSQLGNPYNSYSWFDSPNYTNNTVNYYRQAGSETPAASSPIISNETTEVPITDDEALQLPRYNENLRYIPAIGAGVGALVSAIQPVDYAYANELTGLASNFTPIAAPALGGYRRYNPYDVNLGDAENLALTTAALNNTRNQNRATQGALNTATIGAAQKTAAQRNLAWQQANEKNRLDTDIYNLGIDRTNLSLAQAYDQLNQQIKNNKVNMLANAAKAADDSRTAWSNALSNSITNSLNSIGAIGKENWAANQRNALIELLGNENLAKALGII